MDTSVKHALPPTLRRIKAEVGLDVLLPVLFAAPFILAGIELGSTLAPLSWMCSLVGLYLAFVAVSVFFIGSRYSDVTQIAFTNRLRELQTVEFLHLSALAKEHAEVQRYVMAVAATNRNLCGEDYRRVVQLARGLEVRAREAAFVESVKGIAAPVCPSTEP